MKDIDSSSGPPPSKKRKIGDETSKIPPMWIAKEMENKSGHDPILIMEGRFTKNDVNKQHSCLLLRSTQLNLAFLTDGEGHLLETQSNSTSNRNEEGLKVTLLDPGKVAVEVTLKKRKTAKDRTDFVIINGWKNVVARNEFKAGDPFSIWSFRFGESKLCFALVKHGVVDSDDVPIDEDPEAVLTDQKNIDDRSDLANMTSLDETEDVVSCFGDKSDL